MNAERSGQNPSESEYDSEVEMLTRTSHTPRYSAKSVPPQHLQSSNTSAAGEDDTDSSDYETQKQHRKNFNASNHMQNCQGEQPRAKKPVPKPRASSLRKRDFHNQTDPGCVGVISSETSRGARPKTSNHAQKHPTTSSAKREIDFLNDSSHGAPNNADLPPRLSSKLASLQTLGRGNAVDAIQETRRKQDNLNDKSAGRSRSASMPHQLDLWIKSVGSLTAAEGLDIPGFPNVPYSPPAQFIPSMADSPGQRQRMSPVGQVRTTPGERLSPNLPQPPARPWPFVVPHNFASALTVFDIRNKSCSRPANCIVDYSHGGNLQMAHLTQEVMKKFACKKETILCFRPSEDTTNTQMIKIDSTQSTEINRFDLGTLVFVICNKKLLKNLLTNNKVLVFLVHEDFCLRSSALRSLAEIRPVHMTVAVDPKWHISRIMELSCSLSNEVLVWKKQKLCVNDTIASAKITNGSLVVLMSQVEAHIQLNLKVSHGVSCVYNLVCLTTDSVTEMKHSFFTRHEKELIKHIDDLAAWNVNMIKISSSGCLLHDGCVLQSAVEDFPQHSFRKLTMTFDVHIADDYCIPIKIDMHKFSDHSENGQSLGLSLAEQVQLLLINPTHSVRKIKHQIQRYCGIPTKMQKLRYKRVELMDSKKFHCYNIQPRDTVLVEEISQVEIQIHFQEFGVHFDDFSEILYKGTSVHELCQNISHRIHVHPSFLTLQHKGKEIDTSGSADLLLGDYNIEHQSKVMVTIHRNRLWLLIRSPYFKSFTHVVNDATSHTVRDLRKSFSNLLVLPFSSINLLYGRGPFICLVDARTLESYNMGCGDVIVVCYNQGAMPDSISRKIAIDESGTVRDDTMHVRVVGYNNLPIPVKSGTTVIEDLQTIDRKRFFALRNEKTKSHQTCFPPELSPQQIPDQVTSDTGTVKKKPVDVPPVYGRNGTSTVYPQFPMEDVNSIHVHQCGQQMSHCALNDDSHCENQITGISEDHLERSDTTDAQFCVFESSRNMETAVQDNETNMLPLDLVHPEAHTLPNPPQSWVIKTRMSKECCTVSSDEGASTLTIETVSNSRVSTLSSDISSDDGLALKEVSEEENTITCLMKSSKKHSDRRHIETISKVREDTKWMKDLSTKELICQQNFKRICKYPAGSNPQSVPLGSVSLGAPSVQFGADTSPLQLQADVGGSVNNVSNWNGRPNMEPVPESCVSDVLLQNVANMVGRKWIELVRYLGVPDSVIDQITRDHQNELLQQAYHGFRAWKEQVGFDATEEFLGTFLRKHNMGYYADCLGLPNIGDSESRNEEQTPHLM